MPIPKLLTPSFITDRAHGYDVMQHTGSYADAIEDGDDLIGEVQEAYDTMMQEVTYISTKVPLRNGYFLLTTGGEVVSEYKSEGYEYDEPHHVVSGAYMEEIRSLINRHSCGISSKYKELCEKYDEAGGTSYYLSGLRGFSDVRYFYCVVEEGKLYTYSYQYDQ